MRQSDLPFFHIKKDKSISCLSRSSPFPSPLQRPKGEKRRPEEREECCADEESPDAHPVGHDRKKKSESKIEGNRLVSRGRSLLENKGDDVQRNAVPQEPAHYPPGKECPVDGIEIAVKDKRYEEVQNGKCEKTVLHQPARRKVERCSQISIEPATEPRACMEKDKEHDAKLEQVPHFLFFSCGQKFSVLQKLCHED